MPDFGYAVNVGDIVELVHTSDELHSSLPARPRVRATVIEVGPESFTVRLMPDGRERVLLRSTYREAPGWIWDQRPPVGHRYRDRDPSKL